MVGRISASELKARLEGPERPAVLDVRESWELEIARLPDVVHIPMGELAARLGELDTERELVVMCRSGGRSLAAAQFLSGRGFKVSNLEGGILAWSREVDPSVAQY